MEIKEVITSGNTKESAKKFGALKNEKHLRLLLYIEKTPDLSMDDIHQFAKNEKLFINRQSTHKALDKITKSGYLRKLYDEKKNKIIYRLKLDN